MKLAKKMKRARSPRVSEAPIVMRFAYERPTIGTIDCMKGLLQGVDACARRPHLTIG